MKIPKFFAFALLFVAPLVLAAGCGGSGASDQPDLGQVTGVIKMDGQPLSNVTITFSPEKGRPSIGKTDEAGNYELGYLGDTIGAVIGVHSVTISTPQEAPTPPGKTYKDPIPKKYNTKSTLKEEVKTGENTIDFDLVSK